MKKSRATIDDVAKRAGVSRQTVSRAINNKNEISEATRQRVLDIVRELGYRPSQIARSLATRKTYTVGLVMPNISNPFFPEVARGVQDLAWANEYNVLLFNTDWDPEKELEILHFLAAQPVDGIILNSSRISDNDLADFADYYRPIVLSGREFEHPSISVTDLNHRQGTRLVVEYLVSQGHRAIGMLAGSASMPTISTASRIDGFRQALKDFDLPVVDDWIVSGPLTFEGGYQTAHQLLAQAPELTAISAHNDVVALGAIKACRELGRRVPDDFAIVGFNDIEFAAMVDPPLTTVHFDQYQHGQGIMTRLIDMIDCPECEFPPIVVDCTELVIRKSA